MSRRAELACGARKDPVELLLLPQLLLLLLLLLLQPWLLLARGHRGAGAVRGGGAA